MYDHPWSSLTDGGLYETAYLSIDSGKMQCHQHCVRVCACVCARPTVCVCGVRVCGCVRVVCGVHVMLDHR